MQIFLALLPENASKWAVEVDFLFWMVTIICTISFLLVQGALIFMVIRYRRKPNEEDRKTPYITHNRTLETVWTVIPTIVVIILFYYGAVTYYDMRRIPSDSYEVEVLARQWNWKFTYANGVSKNSQSVCSEPVYKSKYDCEKHNKTWNQGASLVIPVGKKVRLKMRSADVIHSLYVPAFRVKQDIVPGIISSLWFEATKPGTYELFCAEYCGLDHSGMLSIVTVKPKEEFDKWLIEEKMKQEKAFTLAQTPESMAKAGRELFSKKGCIACHRLNDQRIVGPPLNGIFGKVRNFTDGTKTTADENYITESIMDPAKKIVKADIPYPPMNAQDVNKNEVRFLVEFLKSCKTIDCK